MYSKSCIVIRVIQNDMEMKIFNRSEQYCSFERLFHNKGWKARQDGSPTFYKTQCSTTVWQSTLRPSQKVFLPIYEPTCFSRVPLFVKRYFCINNILYFSSITWNLYYITNYCVKFKGYIYKTYWV